jgi:hypothetical protein
MLIILAIGGAAALAVVAYNRLRERDPDTAAEAVRNVRQLVSVVVVLARATSAVLDTLQGARMHTGPAGISGLRYFDEEEDED